MSKVGKGVMIKSALQAIPNYFISIFLLSSTLGDEIEIERMMNSFWWGVLANVVKVYDGLPGKIM